MAINVYRIKYTVLSWSDDKWHNEKRDTHEEKIAAFNLTESEALAMAVNYYLKSKKGIVVHEIEKLN